MTDKEKIAALEKRINSARAASKPKKLPPTKNIGAFLVMDMVCGLVVGAILGYNLDHLLNSKPLFLFILMVLGIAGGFYNFYRYESKQAGKAYLK